ncbi:hypothetical protein PYJP_07270 [Pyrofollis japonicus]|uniref:hypothetical protein n=1 Tax=Pyrofollis japonicus TaxID=3060460 RepID=UPI00295B5D75|nr:hypothetical protein [Pyrofollis japonicus]BEP17375.1 hypothetical protein PYJP_07270 [Pyrofollis japonicus]
MCRLVAGVARGSGLGLIAELVRLLPLAASDDHYLPAITGGDARHCHGYGFFVARRIRGSWFMAYERFDAGGVGVGGEEACRVNLRALGEAAERVAKLISSSDTEEAVVVFHARRASRGEPRGTTHAHPFLEVVEFPSERIDIYVAHNGGLYKDKLGEEVGVVTQAYTDTQVFAIFLSRMLSLGYGIGEAVERAKKYTRTALDLAIATVSSRTMSPRLYVHGYLAPGLDEKRRKYYEPLLAEAEGLAAYVSSTIADLAKEKGLELAVKPFTGLQELRLSQ